MTITVKATYENGTLKLKDRLPLQEHETVEITVRIGRSLTEQTYGLVGWKGDAGTFERIGAELEEAEDVP